MRQAPFILWLNDLGQRSYFILPLIMGVSMYIQQKLNPPPTDPVQAKVMQFFRLFHRLLRLFPFDSCLLWSTFCPFSSSGTSPDR